MRRTSIKICKDCNRLRSLFSQGRCINCYKKWYVLKENKTKPGYRKEKVKKEFPQKKKLSKRNLKIIREDKKFREQIWNEQPHICEECEIYLGEKLMSTYISHILSRGSNPEMRHDKRNINILCLKHHQMWETGEKKKMKIWDKNNLTINRLKLEYSLRQ